MQFNANCKCTSSVVGIAFKVLSTSALREKSSVFKRCPKMRELWMHLVDISGESSVLSDMQLEDLAIA